MSASEFPPERGRATSIDEAAERLTAIVRATEEAAAAVIDDAEDEARRRLAQAEERADRVIAERLRALADELDPVRGKPEPPVPLRPVQAVATDSEPPRGRRSSSAGARLLATQMAVSGASREEIAERLRAGFEIDDADEILDAILGSEE